MFTLRVQFLEKLDKREVPISLFHSDKLLKTSAREISASMILWLPYDNCYQRPRWRWQEFYCDGAMGVLSLSRILAAALQQGTVIRLMLLCVFLAVIIMRNMIGRLRLS